MILYVTLGTNDLTRAAAFYDAVLPIVGLIRSTDDPDELGFGPPGGEATVWVGTPYDKGRASFANGAMLALTAPSRASVDAGHATALAHGGTDEGAPGLRDYGPDFYACYFRDPDGNKISLVCLTPTPG